MKKILPAVIMVIIIGGGTFFGGMKYANSKNQGKFLTRDGAQNFANMTQEERQQRMQGGQTMGRAMGGQIGEMTAGEIINKDEASITVKLKDGGSRIIFFSDSTEVSKFEKGTVDDLQNGKNVVIGGKKNEDGTISAQTIQIRPEEMPQPEVIR